MTTNGETSDSKPIGYRLNLGAGWTRIRLDEHAEADVEAFLNAAFAAVPADAAEATRGVIAGRLATQITAGRAKGGIDFYVPTPGHGPVPALTMMAAEVKIPSAAVPEPADVVARVAASNPTTARTGVIAGMPAVRIDRSVGAGPDDEPDASDDGQAEDGPRPPRPRHIEYVVPVAGDPDHRWLSIALTGQAGPGADEAAVDAAISAFDQAVSELTWV
jgi:hypothetical protein